MSADVSAMSFKAKVVIVTGAGSGIGAATALKFASLSAKLALVDKDEYDLKNTVEQCRELSTEKHLTIVADLSNTDDVFSVIPKTVERFSRIDVLVNCAGIGERIDLAKEDVTAHYELHGSQPESPNPAGQQSDTLPTRNQREHREYMQCQSNYTPSRHFHILG